jgi:Transposase DDE domain
VEQIREHLEDDHFKNRHRQTAKDFTRVRRLPFGLLMVLMMRKSVKSLQNLLNEAMSWLEQSPVTASAYSQARHKLKHTAFIELNQTAIVKTLYSDGNYQRFLGFRLLAVDGSKLVLPDTENLRDAFGTIAWTTGKNAQIQGERPYALASVMYDVLNRVAVDALLDNAKAYEVDLAVAHLAQTQVGDLLIMDRNYPSYRCLAAITQQQRDFVIRCSAKSFTSARQMLKGDGADSQIVTLSPCAQQLSSIQQNALPTSLSVRFVRVRLSTGEDEVLVTSLLDEFLYPTSAFLELYHLRWGIETFYGLLKTRLALENFTGDSAESVRQDFYAAVFLSGLESLLTDTAQTQLDAKNTRHRQTVNRAVSFNAIKNQAFALLLGDMPIDPLLEKLTALFLANPCLNRPQRHPPRKKSSARVLLNFQKRLKKQCF